MLLRAVERAGVTLESGDAVADVAPTAEGWRVRTASGTVVGPGMASSSRPCLRVMRADSSKGLAAGPLPPAGA